MLEKEALAIVSGVKKFYRRRCTIESDHKPLSYLFHETKGIPQMASARIQRWALTLAAYTYNIKYKAGKALCNADALSRLPCPVTTLSVDMWIMYARETLLLFHWTQFKVLSKPKSLPSLSIHWQCPIPRQLLYSHHLLHLLHHYGGQLELL